MRALLEEIAAEQRRNDYVAPADNVAKKLEAAIEKDHHLTPANLSNEETAGVAKRVTPVFITAIPDRFVDDAESKIDGMVRRLIKLKAKRFEVVFSNRAIAPDNIWGDKVLLAARYSVE